MNLISRVIKRAQQWYIKIDYENNAEEWWGNVQEMDPFSETTKPLTHGQADEVIVTEHEAQAFIDWASQIPGWYDPDAPHYAPEPLWVQLYSE